MSESCDRYKIIFYTGFYCCLSSWKKTCLILITLFVCLVYVSFSIHLALFLDSHYQVWIDAMLDRRALESGYEKSFQPPKLVGYI